MSAIFPERVAPRRRERGFAAIAGIFVLVVLGALGVVMVTVFGAQQRSAAFDWLGMQAYQSARAGIEFGTFQAFAGNCAGSTPIAMPGSLAAFNVTVTCESTLHSEGSRAVTTYEITSTACNRGACPSDADDTYVERQLRVTVASVQP
jgi:MSHA biogenesis protein MshP